MLTPYEGSFCQYDVNCDQVMVPMRDGVRLATDLYRPSLGRLTVDGTFPVILERTPYDKRSPKLVATGKYFASRGYICPIK